MNKLEYYDIGEVLGRGLYGTIYEAIIRPEYLGSKLSQEPQRVVKIEKILPGSLSIFWENEFAFEMSSLYPDHFMKLLDYRFSSTYNHVQERDVKLSNLVDRQRLEIEKLDNSKWCIFRLYTRVNANIGNLQNFTQDELRLFLCQIFNITGLIMKHEYRHGDLHLNNFGYTETDQKEIICHGTKIPTLGRLYKCIDYGSITSQKWYHKVPSYKKYLYNTNYHENLWGIQLMYVNTFWDLVDMTKLNSFDKVLAKMREYKLPDEIQITPKCATLELVMYQLFLNKEWQQAIYPKPVKNVIFKRLLPDEYYYFYCKNWTNSAKLIKKFA